MSREIEDMARDLENHTCMSQFQAEIASKMLYAKGYRKQIEGEWIVYGHSYECSNCGFEYETDVFAEDYNPITDFDLHFCSVCGALMKGGDRDGT